MDTGELFDYNLKSPPTFNPFEGRSNGNSDKVILLPYPSYNPFKTFHSELKPYFDLHRPSETHSLLDEIFLTF